MLCCIQNVIEKTLLMSERTFIVFIDYSKAFDMVSHIQGFLRYIVNDTLERITCIPSLSSQRRAYGRDVFYHHSLFCAYTEQVIRETEITESGALIGGKYISNLRYSTV